MVILGKLAKKYDYLIVGAGLSGAVIAERIASQLDKKVLIIDRRDHIGGNCYDYYVEDGLIVHKYGPHWFHTNSEKIFKYLSKFTEWISHEHRVKSCVDGKLYPFPINLDTINLIYGTNLKSENEMKEFLEKVRVHYAQRPRNAEEQVLSIVGKELYKKFFEGYTKKHWNIEPKQLDASVTARIPVRFNKDDRYFTDKFQGIPKDGYHKLFFRMLNHPRIDIWLNCDWKSVESQILFDKVIFTGAIDEFFDYQFGKLPYRSIKLEHKIINQEYFQSAQQVNYPNDFDFTRIVEIKHVTGVQKNRTVISIEYSCDPEEVNNEKYYPVPMPESKELYEKYRKYSEKVKNVLFVGRLAEYKYYNMDQIVARALTVFETKIAKGIK